MLRFFKVYYTCEIFVNGLVVGSSVDWIWFWQSPAQAHKKLIANSRNYGAVANFRKVK